MFRSLEAKDFHLRTSFIDTSTDQIETRIATLLNCCQRRSRTFMLWFGSGQNAYACGQPISCLPISNSAPSRQEGVYTVDISFHHLTIIKKKIAHSVHIFHDGKERPVKLWILLYVACNRWTSLLSFGGESRIRTHGTVSRSLDFKSSAIDQLCHLSVFLIIRTVFHSYLCFSDKFFISKIWTFQNVLLFCFQIFYSTGIKSFFNLHKKY